MHHAMDHRRKERHRSHHRREPRHGHGEAEARDTCVFRTKDGIPPARCLTKMEWHGSTSGDNFNSPGGQAPVFQANANALVGIQGTASPPASRAAFALQWGNFYQYYKVNASRIKIRFNSTSQPGYLFLWPTLFPGSSGVIPVDLDTAFEFPLVKYKFFGSEGFGGTDDAYIELEHYVDFAELLGADVYAGSGSGPASGAFSGITGVLPYDGSTGYTSETGTRPPFAVFWQYQFWSSSSTNEGSVSGDLSVEIEFFTELFQPCPDKRDEVMPLDGLVKTMRPMLTIDRPGLPPEFPMHCRFVADAEGKFHLAPLPDALPRTIYPIPTVDDDSEEYPVPPTPKMLPSAPAALMVKPQRPPIMVPARRAV